MFLPVPPPTDPEDRSRRPRLGGPIAGAVLAVLAAFAVISLGTGGPSPGGDDDKLDSICCTGFVALVGGFAGYLIQGLLGGRGWRRAWEASPDERPEAEPGAAPDRRGM